MVSIYNADYVASLKRLKQARKTKKITQQQLADALGRPQSFIAKIESGERRLDFIEFITIARLVGLQPEELIAMVSTRSTPLISPQENPIKSD